MLDDYEFVSSYQSERDLGDTSKSTETEAFSYSECATETESPASVSLAVSATIEHKNKSTDFEQNATVVLSSTEYKLLVDKLQELSVKLSLLDSKSSASKESSTMTAIVMPKVPDFIVTSCEPSIFIPHAELYGSRHVMKWGAALTPPILVKLRITSRFNSASILEWADLQLPCFKLKRSVAVALNLDIDRLWLTVKGGVKLCDFALLGQYISGPCEVELHVDPSYRYVRKLD